jgi:hypothetical protein
MENVSICPWRANVTYSNRINWSAVQTTRLSHPVTFSGTARDLKLLEAIKAENEAPIEVPPGAEAVEDCK